MKVWWSAVCRNPSSTSQSHNYFLWTLVDTLEPVFVGWSDSPMGKTSGLKRKSHGSCNRFCVKKAARDSMFQHPPPFRRGAWIFSASPWKFPSEKNQATITRKIMFLVAEKKQFHQLSCRFQRISGKSWAIYLDHQETENLINLSF